MAIALRQALAWLRRRWHADLEFQHSGQRQELAEMCERLIGCQDAHATRLHQLESNLNRQQSEATAAWNGIDSRLLATAEIEPRLQQSLGRLQEQLKGLDCQANALSAELRGLASAEEARATATEARVAANDARADALADSLHHKQQEIQAALELLPVVRDELQAEQQRRREWETRMEAMHGAWLAAESRSRELEQRLRAQDSRPPLSAEDRAAIERQGVFIVGSARSGTTILSDCLNLSSDVYLLQEAFFFCNELAAAFAGPDNYDFAATFNARHVGYGNPRDKGTYVPTAERKYRTPLEFLNDFRGKYRYLGEKVAFGPQPHYMGDEWENDFLAYQARYFYRSRYFITVRTPHEAIWSMHKLFPDRPIPALFECWLRSLRVSLDVYLAFPHTHLILMEWLDEFTIERVANILQTEIPLRGGFVGRDHQSSALGPDDLVPVLRPYRDWCHSCAAIYDQVRGTFHRESLRFESSQHPREFAKEIGRQIAELLEDVMSHSQVNSAAA